ncbi:hypothetical protein [Jiangella alkaliphila]|uniref:Uncharacterized protein n=1 Tax=Jiangella alkaliphila TaxID=419479 RepID=A0A1H2JS97_9ACTN|nr:hypothetical protein [Jiangella alkaliphila]SDU59434.1 hypothetical protein SAMN04488563_3034 [Jiangella alkaliphila]
MLRAVLAAAGKQLHAELEPLDADVRAAIARVAAQPIADRKAVMHWYWLRGYVGADYRVEGVAAAELLGAPLPVDHLDIALADEPAAFATLVCPPSEFWARLSVRRHTWSFGYPRLRLGADDREIAKAVAGLRDVLRDECPDGTFWMANAGCRARVRLVPPDEVGSYVEVATPEGVVRVAPLHEIESTDPRVTRVLRVLREDATTARPGERSG